MVPALPVASGIVVGSGKRGKSILLPTAFTPITPMMGPDPPRGLSPCLLFRGRDEGPRALSTPHGTDSLAHREAHIRRSWMASWMARCSWRPHAGSRCPAPLGVLKSRGGARDGARRGGIAPTL